MEANENQDTRREKSESDQEGEVSGLSWVRLVREAANHCGYRLTQQTCRGLDACTCRRRRRT